MVSIGGYFFWVMKLGYPVVRRSTTVSYCFFRLVKVRERIVAQIHRTITVKMSTVKTMIVKIMTTGANFSTLKLVSKLPFIMRTRIKSIVRNGSIHNMPSKT